MKTCLYSIVVSMLGIAALTAQAGPQRSVVVRGEITSNSPLAGNLSVEIDGMGSGPLQNAMVQGDGSFEFPSVSPGTHQLRVLTAGGVIVHTEQVVIRDAGQPLSIRIEAPASANRAMGGGGSTVSLRALTHKVPASAQNAFSKGERDALKGNYKEAAELFRQAIALDPEFADAYNELAAAEASLGDLSKSAEDFQKAVDLDPEHRYALPNLAIVLAKLSRFPEAGDVARRALKVVPGSGKLHYILAVSMMEENGDFDEIIRHLGRATEEVPRAHLVAADLLIQKGRRDDAVRHLEDYLIAAKPDDEYRTKVQARLIELQH